MADVWKSQPKKYCEVCKCWLADNKVSREFHEEGTRHKAAVQRKISELHFKENEKMKAEKDMKANMELLNAAAYQGMLKDIAKDPKKVSVYGVEMNDKTRNDIKKELLKMPSAQLIQSNVQQDQKKCQWKSARTKEGLIYYWNVHTKQSTWEKPSGFVDEEQKDKKIKRTSTLEEVVPVKKSRIVFNNNIKRDIKPDLSPIDKSK